MSNQSASSTQPKRRLFTLRNVLVATGAVLYGVSPVDAIPDVLLGLGQVDDIAVLSAAVALIVSWYRGSGGRIKPEAKGD